MASVELFGQFGEYGEMREKVDRDVETALGNETYSTNLDLSLKSKRNYLEKPAEAAQSYGCGNRRDQSKKALFIFVD